MCERRKLVRARPLIQSRSVGRTLFNRVHDRVSRYAVVKKTGAAAQDKLTTPDRLPRESQTRSKIVLGNLVPAGDFVAARDDTRRERPPCLRVVIGGHNPSGISAPCRGIPWNRHSRYC